MKADAKGPLQLIPLSANEKSESEIAGVFFRRSVGDVDAGQRVGRG